MTTCEREVKAALARAIVNRIGEPRYNLWFNHNAKYTLEDDLLVVGVPNRFLQEWMEKTFATEVRAAAGDVFGQSMRVRFAIDPELFQAARQAQEAAGESSAEEPAVTTAYAGGPAKKKSHHDHSPLQDEDEDTAPALTSRPSMVRRQRRWRQLNEFVVGSCNRLAHAAAVSVVEAPGHCANPLVLYGSVGTGKTHLLEGIRAGLRRHHPEWKVRCLPSEDFTNRFLQALNGGKLGGFRKDFRECDALLIDDLNFLAKKRASQEEFLHTLDVLVSDGRQVVITCDGHPRLADEFSPELADRLLGGGIWPLEPPDADTRLSILRAHAIRLHIIAPDDVYELLARSLRGNVRELEGALHGVHHCSQVAGRPIDISLAREALGELLRHAARVVSLVEVDRAVCQALHLPEGTLQARQRSWAVSHPRMLAMYLARKHTAAAYSEIGQYFGGRNHSTVLAAEKKVRQWLQGENGPLLGERRLRASEAVERIEREMPR